MQNRRSQFLTISMGFPQDSRRLSIHFDRFSVIFNDLQSVLINFQQFHFNQFDPVENAGIYWQLQGRETTRQKSALEELSFEIPIFGSESGQDPVQIRSREAGVRRGWGQKSRSQLGWPCSSSESLDPCDTSQEPNGTLTTHTPLIEGVHFFHSLH